MNAAPLRPARPLDYAKLVTMAAIWGSAFMFVAIALEGLPPLAVSSIRVLVGGAVLAAVGMAMGERWPRGGRLWFWIAVVGLLNTALPFSLIALGQQGVAANRAAILMATTPFATLMLSHLFTHDDRISGPKLFGLTLGVSGVILVVGLDALTVGGQSVAGQLAIVGAGCCYAASNVLTRKLSHLPQTLGTAALLVSTAPYMAVLLAYSWPEVPPADWRPWAAALALGLGPTAVAFLLRFQLIRDVGSTFMSQVGYMVPVSGVLWAWAVLGEVPGLSAIGALVLILAGIRVTQWKRKPAPVAATAE